MSAAHPSEHCELAKQIRRRLDGVLGAVEWIQDKLLTLCPAVADVQTQNADKRDPVMRKLDAEYEDFLIREREQNKKFRTQYNPNPPQRTLRRLTEIPADLFLDAPPSMALAHCVGEDLLMSAGIAVDFKRRFGQVDDLLSQRKKVGEVAALQVPLEGGGVRHVFYIITKKYSKGKRPEMKDVNTALAALAEKCNELGVTQLGMPRIGAYHDKLDWPTTRMAINKAFENFPSIEVFVFTRRARPEMTSTPCPSASLSATPERPTFSEVLNTTPPFSTPKNTTPVKLPVYTVCSAAKQNELVPGGPNQTAAPGTPARLSPQPIMHSGAVEKGPCAATVMGDAQGGAGAAVAPSTAQGRPRSVQNSPVSPTMRHLNDLKKSAKNSAKNIKNSNSIDQSQTLSCLPPSDSPLVPQVQPPSRTPDEVEGRQGGSQNQNSVSPSANLAVGLAAQPEEQVERHHPFADTTNQSRDEISRQPGASQSHHQNFTSLLMQLSTNTLLNQPAPAAVRNMIRNPHKPPFNPSVFSDHPKNTNIIYTQPPI
jgi:O-acetyl-ADP-ribose deacetylase (regulator of RNase III)